MQEFISVGVAGARSRRDGKLLRRAVRRRRNRGRRTERLPSREAILHKFGIQRGSIEPARVLHCSTDVDASAGRSQRAL